MSDNELSMTIVNIRDRLSPILQEIYLLRKHSYFTNNAEELAELLSTFTFADAIHCRLSNLLKLIKENQ